MVNVHSRVTIRVVFGPNLDPFVQYMRVDIVRHLRQRLIHIEREKKTDIPFETFT